MEEESIHHLSLFLDNPIYLLEEEKGLFISKAADSNPLPAVHAPIKAEEKEEVIEEETPVLTYEGNFEKGVLVAFDAFELSAELKDLLFKILDAVGCGLKDIALCHSGLMENAGMEEILALNPTKVIVFGRIKHPLMHLQKAMYTIELIEETEYLFADSLEQIYSNKELKKSLWGSLKTLFNVSK